MLRGCHNASGKSAAGCYVAMCFSTAYGVTQAAKAATAPKLAYQRQTSMGQNLDVSPSVHHVQPSRPQAPGTIAGSVGMQPWKTPALQVELTACFWHAKGWVAIRLASCWQGLVCRWNLVHHAYQGAWQVLQQ